MTDTISPKNDSIFYNHQLSGLAITLSAYNYVVDFEVKTFTINNPIDNFTLEMVQQLYPAYPDANPITGTIRPINFDEAKNELDETILSIKANCPYDENYGLTRSRVIYWAIINQALQGGLPPTSCYVYEPDHACCSNYLMWEFWFVLVNNNAGVVISAKASN